MLHLKLTTRSLPFLLERQHGNFYIILTVTLY